MSRNKLVNAFRPFPKGRTLTLASRALICSMLVTAIGYADCLPSVPTGWVVPFHMSTHNVISNSVGYSTGGLVNSSSTVPFLSGDNFQQLFSDRIASLPCGPTPCFGESQPFTVSRPDYVGVSITRTEPRVGSGTAPTISVTLTLDSWGRTKYTFTASCDATTNLLYGSFNNNTMAVFSFDSPSSGIIP